LVLVAPRCIRIITATMQYDRPTIRVPIVCGLVHIPLLVLAASVSAEETIDAPTLLEKMKASDAKYHAGFSLSGTIVVRPLGSQPERTTHFRFTCAGAKYALEKQFESTTQPSYDSLRPPQQTRIVYDGRPGKNPQNVLIIHEIIWTAGRDFSDYLDSITDVGPTDKPGWVSVTGKGGLSEKDKGQWKLVVDCDADYLVRDAEFTLAKDAQPLFEIHNEGFNLRGLSCYPSQGTFCILPGTGRMPDAIAIDASLRRPDTELLQSASPPLELAPAESK